MRPQEYYHKRIEEISLLLKGFRQRRNRYTAVKIAAFLAAVAFIGWFSTNGMTGLLALFFVCVALFVFINIRETKLLRKIAFHEELRNGATLEEEYLRGDYSRLDTGEEYKDPAHPYAHDLDIFGEDSVFQAINRTTTRHGRERLREWLLAPLRDSEEILRRQEAVGELAAMPDWCHTFRALGNYKQVSKLSPEAIKNSCREKSRFAAWKIPFLYILPGLNILGWVLYIADVIPAAIPELLSLALLAITLSGVKQLNKAHEGVNSFIRSFSDLYELIRHFSSQTFQSARLREIHDELFNQRHDANEALRELYRVQEGFDQRGNVLVTILLDALYMRDLHLYLRLIRWQNKYASCIPGWVDIVGELDTFVSMANYRYNHPDFVTPELSDDTLLRGEEIGHPLLVSARCVTNDFEVSRLHQFYIVTGANMAGKSTFLRAVGVNLVLACCGSVVRASSFRFQPMRIFTSMRTVDNLAKGTSYFHAELLRLKQLVETAQNEEKLFIILDEILKGTNSRDKLNGSRRFLQKLLSLPIAGLIATHDLELGELADAFPRNYFNRCFEITHTDDDIAYDYKLKEGVSQNMNASILLEKMGLV